MGPELNIPKFDVKENWGEDIKDTKDNLVKEINDILNNNEKINDIGKMLDRKFLEWITPEIAQTIIGIIPAPLKSDPDVQNVITVLSAKINKTGNDTEFNKTQLDTDNNTKYQVDLLKYKENISTLKTWINQCLWLIWESSNLRNLKANLEWLNKILSTPNAQLNDLNKIDQFLENNKINVNPRTENDIKPLLEWIGTFLTTVGGELTTHRSANRILDEQEQKVKAEKDKKELEQLEKMTKLTEMSASFWELEKKIPNDLWNLSKLNKKDIQNIKEFVTESKNGKSIWLRQQPRKNVFDLYLKMYQCQETLNGKGITHRDRDNFNEIFKCISDTFKKNEIQEYEVVKWFNTNKINITNLKKAAPDGRDWKKLDGNDAFVQERCRWHVFKPKDYTKKFNSINDERINKNITQLKEFNDESIFTEEEKGKFKIETSEDNKTILKFWESVLDSNGSNLVSTLWLNGKIKDYFNKNKWETNFINDNELINLINNNTDIQQERYNKILEKVKKVQQAAQAEAEVQNPTHPDWEGTTPETQTENLEELQANDITNLFSRNLISAEQVANFFNEAIKKSDLSEEHTSLLLLAQKWLTAQKWANEDIKALQGQLWVTPDWKFGINTFNALLKKFWEKEIQIVKKTVWSKLPEVTIKWESIETEQNRLIKNLQLKDTKLQKDEKQSYWIEEGTKTFTRDNYTWIYYFDNQNTIHYIPDLSQAWKDWNLKCDNIALCKKSKDGIRRGYEQPKNIWKFWKYYKKIIQDDVSLSSLYEIKYDTKNNMFCLSDRKNKINIDLTTDVLTVLGNSKHSLKLAMGRLKCLNENDPNYKNQKIKYNQTLGQFWRNSSYSWYDGSQWTFRQYFTYPKELGNKPDEEEQKKIINYLSWNDKSDIFQS